MLNRQLAKIYLQEGDPELIRRSWNDVIEHFTQGRSDSKTWKSIQQSEPFSVLRGTLLFETQPLHFWRVLKHPKATASTQRWLKQLRNYAWGLGWLLQPVLPGKAWPKIHPKKRRGITQTQHQRIVAAEPAPERRRYYQMLWLTGGAQVDVANFHRDGVDESTQTFRYQRKKMRNRGRGYCFFPMGEAFRVLLGQCPTTGSFFPNMRLETTSARAHHFKRLCTKLEISNVTLHCYRYAWAERAKRAGMLLNQSMTSLGHTRKSRHLAYARSEPGLPHALEEYEQRASQPQNP